MYVDGEQFKKYNEILRLNFTVYKMSCDPDCFFRPTCAHRYEYGTWIYGGTAMEQLLGGDRGSPTPVSLEFEQGPILR